MAKIELTLTLEQANAVVQACELYTRIGLGQLEAIEELARGGEIPFAVKYTKIESQDIKQLRQLMYEAKGILGFDYNESMGLGSKGVTKTTHRAYEVRKVLEKALAEHRNPNPSFQTVDYDGLTVRYTDDPAPAAVVKESEK